jgi:hypothetical protein
MGEGEAGGRWTGICCRMESLRSRFGSGVDRLEVHELTWKPQPAIARVLQLLALSRGDCSSCPGPAPPPLVPSQAELKRSGFRPLPASALSTTTPSHAFPFACRFDFLLYNVFTNCSHNYVFPSEFIYSLKTTTIASPATLLFNNLGQTGNTRSLHIECFQDADRKGMMGNYSFGWHSANITSSMDLSPPSPLPSSAR